MRTILLLFAFAVVGITTTAFVAESCACGPHKTLLEATIERVASVFGIPYKAPYRIMP